MLNKSIVFTIKSSILLLLILIVSSSCQEGNITSSEPQIVAPKNVSSLKLDGYPFEAPIEYKYLMSDNKENIQFTLNNPNTHTIIFQNKFSALDGVDDKKLSKNAMILKLHDLKYKPLIADFGPTEVSDISVNQIEDINFSLQTFKTNFDEKDIFFDLRVLSIKGDYYAIYSFGQNVYKDINFNSTNDIIESLSQN